MLLGLGGELVLDAVPESRSTHLLEIELSPSSGISIWIERRNNATAQNSYIHLGPGMFELR